MCSRMNAHVLSLSIQCRWLQCHLCQLSKLYGAASLKLDSVIASKGSLSHELLMACWTTLSRSNPVQQGWFSLRQILCQFYDSSTAVVSAQLLNELIIIVFSQPHADNSMKMNHVWYMYVIWRRCDIRIVTLIRIGALIRIGCLLE